MSFYSSIAEAYDEIFPLNKVQAKFVEGLCSVLTGKRVLDAGCGTGSLAIELGRRGAAVEAFDLDLSMIQVAEDKCPQALNVKFSEGDLLTFGNDYPAARYDVVYCFGNTLAHLSGEDDFNVFLQSAKTLLKPRGLLLFQVVNYDRIMREKIDHLPTIESDRFVFERNYSFPKEDVVLFSTILKEKSSEVTLEQKVPLFPMQSELIKKCLKEDFEELSFWGSFKKDSWEKDSFHTVVQAKLK
ncbi:class I SAM-dependent methyltransferase [Labilibacter sediminis]|nr:class I SAM-dependent methyltransferase [Labilibacter sediminis]